MVKYPAFLFFVLCIITLVLYGVSADTQPAEIHFINVGYGDSIFIKISSGYTILIDGGYQEQGANVLKYLEQHCRKKSLDMMICTHPHPDHIGGLITIAKNYTVHSLISNMDFTLNDQLSVLKEIVSKKNQNSQTIALTRGSVIYPVQDVKITVLNPQKITDDLNYSSLVLMVEIFKFKILFGGDIEETGEKELTEIMGHNLRAHILKLPHHGNSGYCDFINSVKPLIGIISVGENEWGAPNLQTIKTLDENKTLILRTDKAGGIILQLFKNGRIKIKSESGAEKTLDLTL
ncbi:MAG: hypothetical protein A2161_19550 [Candidatus Schekmanbacteria bacterium RBG_13_48_7]|uniref:Metallo-beta-lactamase domain-containing protein n=1 Tax=Candidatus Schekmanbacteria bacterium RBG_13_48_7 TaxID=1817878 RepID=A0A1F7S3J3_9BACT|nr:MAG: hypothetical protein A2161_19550 [Candidatus Schekmanbacteria bacterium RBG_13_48_7]